MPPSAGASTQPPAESGIEIQCVQLGRRLSDQVANQNNITPDRRLGDRNGARHHEVVQSDKGLWVHPAYRRRQGHVRPHTAVEQAGLSTLNEGQSIEYETESNRGKESAVKLKVR